MFKVKLLNVALIVAACFANAVQAAETDARRWYAGGGFGVAEVNKLCQGVPDQWCDADGFALQGFAGWQVNRYFALEAALSFAGSFTTPSARVVGYDGDTSAAFFGVNAIGFVPLGSRVSLLGGVSGAFTYAVTDVADDYYTTRECDWEYDWFDDDWEYRCRNRRYEDDRYESDVNVAGGLLAGVQVQVTRRFHVRGQVQRFFDVDGGLSFGKRRDVDIVTANVLFSF